MAMAVLKLTFDNDKIDHLSVIGEKNVKFIAAKSLTQTSKIIQSKVREHLHEQFVLRKPNFEKSIKIRPATVQRLQTETYTMAGFATLQQTGGYRIAKSGRLAVPQYTDLRQLKPNRSTDVPGSFVLRLRSGERVIAHRSSKGLEVLFYLKNFARVPKRLHMLEIGTEIATSQFQRIFDDNLRHFTP